MASSTIISESKVAKQITLLAPSIYDEVLLLLKPRLPQTSSNVASVEIWKFYADLLEAYRPELLAKIRQWNAGDAAEAVSNGLTKIGGSRAPVRFFFSETQLIELHAHGDCVALTYVPHPFVAPEGR
jgi:hypothetical protein